MTQKPQVTEVALRDLPVPARRILGEEIDRLLVWRTPMLTRFRGIDAREGLLVHGPAGWGEISPFWDYGAAEIRRWVAAGIEAATQEPPQPRRQTIPVNITVPILPADAAYQLVKTCISDDEPTSAKVKVSGAGTDLNADAERVAAVRDALGRGGRIRVDANAGWTPAQAHRAIRVLQQAAGDLEYVEQPCGSVTEMAELRRSVDVQIAADESIRRSSDPLAVRREQAADLIILKVQPLGGVRAALRLAEELGLPAVVSSALDSSIGIAAGLRLAAALPELDHACGLGTVRLLTADPARESLLPRANTLPADGCCVPREPLDADTVPQSVVAAWVARLSAASEVVDVNEAGAALPDGWWFDD
ncbi:MAG: o-succinylbenzoate synthase [Varibaculum sp.]|nr:o-succinylbenzoate synthase [Varibaculum sp.]